jgi:hypothetical protein
VDRAAVARGTAVGFVLFVVLAATRAAAADVPGMSLQAGLGTGVGYADLAGVYRDDVIGGLRLGVGIGEFVAVDAALAEDTERVEAAFGLGARVRPWRGECWRARWTPYLRAQVSIVGASHLGSNYDLLAGAGHWGRIASRVAWFIEADLVVRVGEYDSAALRVEAGVALHTLAFWRD